MNILDRGIGQADTPREAVEAGIMEKEEGGLRKTQSRCLVWKGPQVAIPSSRRLPESELTLEPSFGSCPADHTGKKDGLEAEGVDLEDGQQRCLVPKRN